MVAYSIPMEYVHKFLVFLTHEEVLGVWSTRENDLLRSVLVAHKGAVLVIFTYEEISDGV